MQHITQAILQIPHEYFTFEVQTTKERKLTLPEKWLVRSLLNPQVQHLNLSDLSDFSLLPLSLFDNALRNLIANKLVTPTADFSPTLRLDEIKINDRDQLQAISNSEVIHATQQTNEITMMQPLSGVTLVELAEETGLSSQELPRDLITCDLNELRAQQRWDSAAALQMFRKFFQERNPHLQLNSVQEVNTPNPQSPTNTYAVVNVQLESNHFYSLDLAESEEYANPIAIKEYLTALDAEQLYTHILRPLFAPRASNLSRYTPADIDIAKQQFSYGNSSAIPDLVILTTTTPSAPSDIKLELQGQTITDHALCNYLKQTPLYAWLQKQQTQEQSWKLYRENQSQDLYFAQPALLVDYHQTSNQKLEIPIQLHCTVPQEVLSATLDVLVLQVQQLNVNFEPWLRLIALLQSKQVVPTHKLALAWLQNNLTQQQLNILGSVQEVLQLLAPLSNAQEINALRKLFPYLEISPQALSDSYLIEFLLEILTQTQDIKGFFTGWNKVFRELRDFCKNKRNAQLLELLEQEDYATAQQQYHREEVQDILNLLVQIMRQFFTPTREADLMRALCKINRTLQATSSNISRQETINFLEWCCDELLDQQQLQKICNHFPTSQERKVQELFAHWSLDSTQRLTLMLDTSYIEDQASLQDLRISYEQYEFNLLVPKTVIHELSEHKNHKDGNPRNELARQFLSFYTEATTDNPHRWSLQNSESNWKMVRNQLTQAQLQDIETCLATSSSSNTDKHDLDIMRLFLALRLYRGYTNLLMVTRDGDFGLLQGTLGTPCVLKDLTDLQPILTLGLTQE